MCGILSRHWISAVELVFGIYQIGVDPLKVLDFRKVPVDDVRIIRILVQEMLVIAFRGIKRLEGRKLCDNRRGEYFCRVEFLNVVGLELLLYSVE